MAAIIAQLSRANWERKKNKRKAIPPEKSTAYLPPFERTFLAEKHNKYVRCKLALIEKIKAEKLTFAEELLVSEKNLLNDGVRCFQRNFRRQINISDQMDIHYGLDPLKALAGAIFLGIFIAVFVFLVAIFWNV
ncbi:uncharacterized protein LOC131881106 [Tigriopus californicus]|uniref:uncharacterized protein LOC131881106 n=1 Tax=Tigriopus californicus TaxID=6832 RepID=UPI0027D9F34E|nr:uncharacterized protein LOC131881106 [Tigriopus californicus]